jgi:hypothetical protein
MYIKKLFKNIGNISENSVVFAWDGDLKKYL